MGPPEGARVMAMPNQTDDGAANPYGAAISADGSTLWATLAGVRELGILKLGALQALLAGCTVTVHEQWTACAQQFEGKRVFAVSTKGAQRYDVNRYVPGDVFLFGPETRGLPAELLNGFSEERRIRLPMLPESRSLNLSNAVAVVIYEAMRQSNFGPCQ